MERLRLTWEYDARDCAWYADGGLLVCSAYERTPNDESPDSHGWRVIDRSGAADTLLAAQLAAEAAALDLLVGAVAAFGVEAPSGLFVQVDRPTTYMLVRPDALAAHNAADATRLACALLAAARGAKP